MQTVLNAAQDVVAAGYEDSLRQMGQSTTALESLRESVEAAKRPVVFVKIEGGIAEVFCTDHSAVNVVVVDYDNAEELNEGPETTEGYIKDVQAALTEYGTYQPLVECLTSLTEIAERHERDGDAS